MESLNHSRKPRGIPFMSPEHSDNIMKFGSEGALPTPLERIVMVLESAHTQYHAATGKETDLPF